MSTPPFDNRQVIGTYEAPDGSPVAGQVRFQPSTTVLDSAGNVVVPPTPLLVTLNASGAFAIDLLVTDAVGTSPTGWTWDVKELFAGGRSWSFQLPSVTVEPVQIGSLAPAIATPSPTYQYATSAALSVVDGRVTNVESSLAVLETAVMIHPFLLMGA